MRLRSLEFGETKTSYFVLLTTRNRCTDLDRTLLSLVSQHLKPERIIILDDGSTDGTVQLLEHYGFRLPSTIQVIRHTDMGYDIKRVASNWNECLEEARRQGLDRTTKFTLITADDCIYPPDYVSRMVDRMKEDRCLMVVSGTRGIPTPLDGWKPPEGTGRLIRNAFLLSLGFHFPEKSGYESWIVYEALRLGHKVECIEGLRYEHLERLGGGHGFEEWGYMPHSLGYHPLFFLGRCVQNLASGTVPRRQVFKILLKYLAAFFVKPQNKFYELHSPCLRSFVWRFQLHRMKRLVFGGALKTLHTEACF